MCYILLNFSINFYTKYFYFCSRHSNIFFTIKIEKNVLVY